MQFIYHLTIWFVGLTILSVEAQLVYTDRSRDDGPCKYPSPVPLLNANFLINPLKDYYIPVASENFYRFEYQMVLNKPAQTEDDISALLPFAEMSKADALEHLSAISVYFFKSRAINYSYRLFPIGPFINPLFSFTASTVHGSSNSAPSGFGGPILFTIIWNDFSPAYNVYTCIGGRQMFHIITGAPSLTDDQLKTVDAFMSVCTIFVFMALMEYCLVNIVLGDTALPKPIIPPPPPEPPKPEKTFDYAPPKCLQNGRRSRCSQDSCSDVPWVQRQDTLILHPQPLPPEPPKPKLTPAQQRLRRAILIDRFSRGFFPFLFTLLNSIYWILFYEYL